MKRINFHLREPDRRSRFYRYDRTVPADVQSLVGQKVIAFSLKVTDPVQARKLRDEWDHHYEAEWARLRQQTKLNAEARLIAEAKAFQDHMRKPAEPVASKERRPGHTSLEISAAPKVQEDTFDQPELKKLVDRTRQIAIDRLPVSDRDDEQKIKASLDWVNTNTEEGRLLRQYMHVMVGRRSYVDLGSEYLDRARKKRDGKPLSDKSKESYRKAFERADKYRLPSIEQVDWDIAGDFLQDIADTEGLSQKTIGNIATALSNLWKFNKKQRTVWRGHEVQTEHIPVEHEAWFDDELRALLAGSEGHWMRDVIWIALYTGHRRSVIAKIEYDPETDFIRFKHQKQEVGDRFYPCHPHIREAVVRYTARPYASITIGNEFRELRDRLDLRPQDGERKKDFHSLRSNTTAQLMQKGIADNNIDVLVGRKSTSITSGVYGFKTLPPHAKAEIERWRPLVETVDWSYLLSDNTRQHSMLTGTGSSS